MAFGNTPGDDAPLSEINVTPLVDVMLVLLVIFIICAPLMAQALRVDLPEADGQPMSEVHRLTVEVSAHGVARIDQAVVAGPELAATVARRLATEPDLVVELAADGAAPYAAVARVISALREAGAGRLAFATRPAGTLHSPSARRP